MINDHINCAYFEDPLVETLDLKLKIRFNTVAALKSSCLNNLK